MHTAFLSSRISSTIEASAPKSTNINTARPKCTKRDEWLSRSFSRRQLSPLLVTGGALAGTTAVPVFVVVATAAAGEGMGMAVAVVLVFAMAAPVAMEATAGVELEWAWVASDTGDGIGGTVG